MKKNAALFGILFMISLSSEAWTEKSKTPLLPELLPNGEEITFKIANPKEAKGFPIRNHGQASEHGSSNFSCEFQTSSTVDHVYLEKNSSWKSSELADGVLTLKKQGSKTQVGLVCFHVFKRSITDGPDWLEDTERCTAQGGKVTKRAVFRGEFGGSGNIGECSLPKPTLDDLKKYFDAHGVTMTTKAASKKSAPSQIQAPAKESEVGASR